MQSKVAVRQEAIYKMVAMLWGGLEKQAKDEMYRKYSSNTAFMRALKIHRHLNALKNELLESESKKQVSFKKDPGSGQVEISIWAPNIRCRRVAYLNKKEFSLLKQNRQVSNVLRKCSRVA